MEAEQPGVQVFCDDPSVEKAVQSALHKFNERLTIGYKLALFQIRSARKVQYYWTDAAWSMRDTEISLSVAADPWKTDKTAVCDAAHEDIYSVMAFNIILVIAQKTLRAKTDVGLLDSNGQSYVSDVLKVDTFQCGEVGNPD